MNTSNHSSNNSCGPHQGRPPKPRGFDRDGSMNSNSRDVSERSTSSRASLMESAVKRRGSLTVPEFQFLSELSINGNEIEVQLAHEKLLDTDLFPVDDDDDNVPLLDDSETGWRSDIIRMGQERESSNSSLFVEFSNGAGPPPVLDTYARTVGSSSTTPPVGSEQRQAVLESRRKNLMHGKMWKAHESGISVSKFASRRSVRGRDIIFRDHNNSYSRMDDVRSDNNRRVSWLSLTTRTRPKIPVGRPVLRRMQSEGSRKSVTFKDVAPLEESPPTRAPPLRLKSEGSIIPRVPPLRLESDGSIPSLHHGHPVTSPKQSSSSSTTTIPSIYHAHPISSPSQRTSSMSSFPSLHHGHPVASPSPKGSVSGNSIPSLHHGHPVTSSSSPKGSVSGNSIPSLHRAHPIRSESCVSAVSDITTEWKKSPTSSSSSFHVPATVIADTTLQDATKLLTANDDDAPILDVVGGADSKAVLLRPVLMRRASANLDNGEGIEILSTAAAQPTEAKSQGGADSSLVTFSGGANGGSVRTSNSFDETLSQGRVSSIFRRVIRRSLSDDSMAGIFLGGSRHLLHENSSLKDVYDDDSSWKLTDEDDYDYYDAWKVVEDEYVNGYGGGGTLPFKILGTSASDVDCHPHVLSPPLMESLQAFFPPSKAGENFWMRYSLVRDGACIHTFLQYARGSKFSILALETIDGEVFGAFTAEPWRKNWNYFGSGESFLWRMRKSRKAKCHSIIDQAQMESEIDVFPFTGVNNCIQLCTHDRIAVGGGNLETSSPSTSRSKKAIAKEQDLGNEFKDHAWGFGITLESDLLRGTTSPCLTFGSPSLSTEHADGSPFEVINLELWSITPCRKVEDAEKLLLSKLFLQNNTTNQ